VRSGTAQIGKWVRETRDITADYQKLFGKSPTSPLQAVGVMADSDNTHSSARVQYRNIEIILGTQLSAEAYERKAQAHWASRFIPKISVSSSSVTNTFQKGTTGVKHMFSSIWQGVTGGEATADEDVSDKSF